MQSNQSKTLAIPFITFHQGEGFALHPDAQEFLGSLSEQRQLGIISIVGRYRTGKSFFVNRVLLNQKKGGFQVGPTINPCTKGLWLWKKAIPSSTNPDMDIIMIDTQGFGGMDENANHDSRIFLFSLLLSSYFIYNSVGSIDQNALNNLNLIINLAKDIQTKTNKGDDISSFPAFLWIVRDFTLMLQDKNGGKISKKQYLENALELQKGNSDAIENKNKIRRHLKHFFTDRDCQTMVRPTQSEKDLQRLDQIDNSKLRTQFVNQVEAIRNKIFGSVKPKKLNDRPLNGNLLLSLCKAYMDIINKGRLPNVQTAWFYVCRSQGLKAIKESTDMLEEEMNQLSQQTVSAGELQNLRGSLFQKITQKFKQRAMGSQQNHPDLIQKLNKRFQECFGDLTRKNKRKWQQKYNQQAQRVTEMVKDRIYNDQYQQFTDFVKDFEEIKAQFDKATGQGDSVQKWRQFNEIAQYLYRLAGEMITTKINKNLHHQKALMQQRLEMQEQELEERHQQITTQKEQLRARLENLEKETVKAAALQQTHKTRALQYKTQHDKLYQKYRQLYSQHQQLIIKHQKINKQHKKATQGDLQQAKSQINSIRTTMEKQRVLHEMEKKYMEEQLTRYKERTVALENQTRKLRTNNGKLTSELQQIQGKWQEKRQEAEVLEQANQTYSRKIQSLLQQNSKKSELVGDHSQWMLQKSYLQNQVSFLKNTVNENKRLHDALLVALQQSINTSQNQNNSQLIQANKNLSAALQKMQSRTKVLQQKYDRVKQFKKMLKHCSGMQCSISGKIVQPGLFASHVEQCLQLKERPLGDSNMQSVLVSVTHQTKEGQNKKPFTEYIVSLSQGDAKWTIYKRYKQFSQLQQMLINRFPSIKYPPSCNFLVDINHLVSQGKRNTMAQQRRRSLQQYLRDLFKIQEIRTSSIFRTFMQMEEPVEVKGKKEKVYV